MMPTQLERNKLHTLAVVCSFGQAGATRAALNLVTASESNMEKCAALPDI